MNMADVAIALDREKRIQSFEWMDMAAKSSCAHIWSSFLHQPFSVLFPQADFSRNQGELSRNGELYDFLRWDSGNGMVYYLKKHTDVNFLYQSALERVTDGVQIYDKDACLVYLNENSRKISDIPDGLSVRGKHLLDMYDLDESISTVLTCLRTAAPVLNRFDTFKTTTGSGVASVNTAYPIFQNKELAGVVVFEQNLEVIQAQIAWLEKIRAALTDQEEKLPPARFSGYTFNNIIGTSQKIADAINLAKRVAAQNSSVLLVGETGTGKEVFAQSIHRFSLRKDKKFVAINCAAIPDTLIEGVFFGTQKGAFTGSTNSIGLLEEADGGTLFLDELNSMSLSMQSKLLRVIQEGTFRRIGGSQDKKTDIRFISSCNEPPAQLLKNNVLRKDLYYRLSTVTIDLPPLREHPEDIPLLAEDYISAKAYKYAKSIESIGSDVIALFSRYSWPGNVRELHNVLDFALNVVDGPVIGVAHLPRYLQDTQKPQMLSAGEHQKESWLHQDLQYTIDAYESQVLRAVLEYYGGNITRAADSLGLRRQSLQYRMKKYGIIQ